MGCERYGCDGLHFPVVQYTSRRTGELIESRPLRDELDERTCEFEDVPDGCIATLAYTRCMTCNPREPEKVPAMVGAPSIEEEHALTSSPGYRLPYADN